jgi:hypothetical protein
VEAHGEAIRGEAEYGVGEEEGKEREALAGLVVAVAEAKDELFGAPEGSTDFSNTAVQVEGEVHGGSFVEGETS